ncbi:MAG: hypothetical protein NVS2B3_18100 [Vulcanimicrobiaceae bacterium]
MIRTASRIETDESEVKRQIARRADPPLVIVDRQCNVLLYSEASVDGAEPFCADGRLAVKLEAIAQRLLRAFDPGDPNSAISFATPSAPWFVRLRSLAGGGGGAAFDDCFALTIETVRNRNQLSEARRRYSLTRRESEVLFEILRGATSTEIAAQLNLAEGTVQGYYKRLLQRTNARNRAAMIALVLGWETPRIAYARERR